MPASRSREESQVTQKGIPDFNYIEFACCKPNLYIGLEAHFNRSKIHSHIIHIEVNPFQDNRLWAYLSTRLQQLLYEALE
jgi:hypothetical protein